MLVVMAREPRPPVEVWLGRRWLAAVDALLWPTLWIAGIAVAPFQTGLAGELLVALAALLAIARLRTAVFKNEHYRLTSVRWGKPIAALVLVTVSLRLSVMFFGQ